MADILDELDQAIGIAPGPPQPAGPSPMEALDRAIGFTGQARSPRRQLDVTPAVNFTLQHSVPFVSRAMSFGDAQAYDAARHRIETGRAQPADRYVVHEHEQREEEARRRTLAENVGRGVAGIPAFVGEMAFGGAVARGLGASARAAQWVGAAVPNVLGAPEEAIGNAAAREQPSSWTDFQNLAPAVAMASLRTAIYGTVGQAAGRIVPGEGAAAWAGRLGVGVGLGLAEIQAVDAIGGAAHLHTRYGYIGDALQGRGGDAMRNVTVDVLTLAAFGAMHNRAAEREPARAGEPPAEPRGLPRPDVGSLPPGGGAEPRAGTPPVMRDFVDVMNHLWRSGLSREGAAYRVQREFAEPIREGLQRNPSATAEEIRTWMSEYPANSPLRRFADSLAETVGAAQRNRQNAQTAPEQPQPAQGNAPGSLRTGDLVPGRPDVPVQGEVRPGAEPVRTATTALPNPELPGQLAPVSPEQQAGWQQYQGLPVERAVSPQDATPQPVVSGEPGGAPGPEVPGEPQGAPASPVQPQPSPARGEGSPVQPREQLAALMERHLAGDVIDAHAVEPILDAAGLTGREREVLNRILVFGETGEQAGHAMGITRERVRQIGNAVSKKLGLEESLADLMGVMKAGAELDRFASGDRQRGKPGASGPTGPDVGIVAEPAPTQDLEVASRELIRYNQRMNQLEGRLNQTIRKIERKLKRGYSADAEQRELAAIADQFRALDAGRSPGPQGANEAAARQAEAGPAAAPADPGVAPDQGVGPAAAAEGAQGVGTEAAPAPRPAEGPAAEERQAAQALRQIFERHFENDSIIARNLHATIGGREITASVEQTRRGNYVTVNFSDPRVEQLHTHVAAALQSGSVELVRRLQAFVMNLAKEGLSVAYETDARRATFYARILERAGFKLQSEKASERGKLYRWEPKAIAQALKERRRQQLEANRPAPTILSIIKKMGGISKETARNHGMDVKAMEKIIPSIFKDHEGRKGRRDISELFEALRNEGHIQGHFVEAQKSPEGAADSSQHAHEWLWDRIQERVRSMDANIDRELDRSYREYLKAKANAERAGWSRGAVEKSAAGGAQAGDAEGREKPVEEIPGAAASGGENDPNDFIPFRSQPGTAVAERAGLPGEPQRSGPPGYRGRTKRVGAVNLEPFAAFAYEVGAQYRELSGQMFPRTTDLNHEVGEKLSRFVAANQWARDASQLAAEKVLGPQGTAAQDALFDATLWEYRARHAEQAWRNLAGKAATPAQATEYMKKANKVGTAIGAPGSPLKTQADYQQAVSSPEFGQAMQRYAAEVGRVLDDLYTRANAHAPDPKNIVTQIPGLPFNSRAGKTEEPSGGGGRGNLRNPKLKRDPFANEATLSKPPEDFSLTKTIQYSYVRRAQIAAQHDAVRAAVAAGVAEWAKPGEQVDFGGRPGRVIPEVRPPEGTQQAQRGEIDLVVHPDAYKEWRKALAPDEPWKSIEWAHAILTRAQLTSLVEAASHGRNMATSMMRPGMRFRDLATNFFKVVTRDLTTRERIVDLALIGAMKDHGAEGGTLWGGTRLDKWVSEKILPEWWQRNLPASTDPTAYVGAFIDVLQRTFRLTADDAFKRLSRAGYALGTETNRRDFINQMLGQYQKRAQQAIVAFLRDTGIGPFATAAATFTVRSLDPLLGMRPSLRATGMPGAVRLRAEMLLKYGAVLAGVALLNYFLWKDIFGSDSTPLGAVRIGTAPDGASVDIDVLGMTGLTRGFRATGIRAEVEGQRRHQTRGQITDRQLDDVWHSLLHPAMGPTVQFIHTARTGEDAIGRHVADRARPGESQAWQNLEAALLNTNPVVAELTGGNRPANRPDQDQPVLGVPARAWRLLGPVAPQQHHPSRR